MERAVLDACVLLQGKLTNFLLCLAQNGGFDPVWSDTITDEWTRNLPKAINIPPDKIAYRLEQMTNSFPVANTAEDQQILAAVTARCLTDSQRKDAHVIATAAAAKAVIIVTENSPDFHATVLSAYGLRKFKPDGFCEYLYGMDPDALVAGARQHRASLVRTPYTPEQYIDFLKDDRFGLVRTGELLSQHLDEI